jgi:hypothetical protein
MNTITRLTAGALGAGVLAVTGAGLASAAETPSGHLEQEPGGTATYALPGVAAPLPDPTLGVPDVLRVAVTPLALLADASGESAPEKAPQGVADAPGAAQPGGTGSGSGSY